MNKIKLPNDWRPRDYQLPLWCAMERGCKRAIAVWHRRGGKDSLALNWTAVAAHRRVGVYWHMLPTQKQARKVVWDGIDKKGRRIINQSFPKEIRTNTNSTEMKIEMRCGSIWQLCGSDNYDALVGANPCGVVFSEWPLTDPLAWDFIRPILAENGGWAMFIYTPRGRNHGWTLFDMAKTNKKWFCQKLTVADTNVVSSEVIQEERDSGMSDEMIEQEYFCSFEAPMFGAYYAKEMERATVATVPYEPNLPVDTYWDLGVDDATSIWFMQRYGLEVRLIDYFEASGEGIPFYVKTLGERPYVYGTHYAPHDIKVREFGTGKTRLETAAKLGIRFSIVPNIGIDDGINAVRIVLPRCFFDKEKCARGIDALRQYHKEWDEQRKIFLPRPYHDWTSHAADSFRYLSVSVNERNLQSRFNQGQAATAENDYDRFKGV